MNHGGNLRAMAEEAGCSIKDILDFSASINPLGIPDWLRQTISSQISELIHYPDPEYLLLRTAMSQRLNIPVNQIRVGNGAEELINILPRALQLTTALLPIPAYTGYERALQSYGTAVTYFKLKEENNFELNENQLRFALNLLKRRNCAVFLGNPNNPTGVLLNSEKMKDLFKDYPNVWFIIDESFIEFVSSYNNVELLQYPNVISVRSMTKILAIPGLRIGYLIAGDEVCRKIEKLLPTWSVNSLSAIVLERSMSEADYFKNTRKKIRQWREEFSNELSQIPNIKFFRSEANFLLIKLLSHSWNADSIRMRLLKDFRIGIRSCSFLPGLNEKFFRIAVRTPQENNRLLVALSSLLCPIKRSRKLRLEMKTPALMFQGTGSNVGKSLMAAAFCRIFKEEGYNVAPFKAQNMALNSFVTTTGGEIGRAQALQAQAAGLNPDVRMNPILLKPSSEKISQVIVNGLPVDNMDFRKYSTFKPKVFEEVKKAYDSLASEHDVMILEGAGSASEVNLKKYDIVNMNMARYAQASVILVGNIDYGGIFGAYIGTLETMAEWERKLVIGFIINRFRGNKGLLKEGIDYLHRFTGKTVFGVVPNLKELNLPEEDSVEFKTGSLSDETPLNGRIDIVLIDIPRISNFTDVDALRMERDVRIRFVRKAEQLGYPDVIILPGSKNIAADLQYLGESGIAKRIIDLAQAQKAEIVGICGGYQMLGSQISDPYGIESLTQLFPGLGLLPLMTTLEKDKFLRQIQGKHLTSGLSISGYEIHHGRTSVLSSKNFVSPAFISADGESLGHKNKDESIWGTYVHGIFDSDEFRREFINKLRAKKRLEPLPINFRYKIEAGIDQLAKSVRDSVDLKAICRKIGI